MFKYVTDGDLAFYQYFLKTYESTPYGRTVSLEAFYKAFFDDVSPEGEMYRWSEAYVAYDGEKMVGFVQYGVPYYYIDHKANRLENDTVGNIKHLYFENGYEAEGRSLLEQAVMHLKEKGCVRVHAFDHCLGSSLHAFHGKLHESQMHIAQLLEGYGFNIEHENVYYKVETERLCLNDDRLIPSDDLVKEKRAFEWLIEGLPIGKASVYEFSEREVYLKSIEIMTEHRSNGYGEAFLKALAAYYRQNGVTVMHWDTALLNKGAQRFYHRLNCSCEGVTRSYVLEGDI